MLEAMHAPRRLSWSTILIVVVCTLIASVIVCLVMDLLDGRSAADGKLRVPRVSTPHGSHTKSKSVPNGLREAA